jgi:hypothetical protein
MRINIPRNLNDFHDCKVTDNGFSKREPNRNCKAYNATGDAGYNGTGDTEETVYQNQPPIRLHKCVSDRLEKGPSAPSAILISSHAPSVIAQTLRSPC